MPERRVNQMRGPIDVGHVRAGIERHRHYPDVSADAYVRLRRIELGESVMRRKRVYLDSCYWIALRDAHLTRASSAQDRSLLSSLRQAVCEARILCPISDALFLELMKQQDVRTRTATAELIDELSNGVTIAPLKERVATEVAHFIYSRCGHPTHPLSELVWSRMSYVLGIVHPGLASLPPADELLMQKAFFDYLWDAPLKVIVSLIGNSVHAPRDFNVVTAQMNQGSRMAASSIKSFVQLYRAELRGMLSVAVSNAREVLESIGARDRVAESDGACKPLWTEQMAFEFLSSELHKTNIARSLPTFHVGALCHAAVRWDQKRRLTGNDLYDFRHAEAAIAYCDVFLTEKPLRSMLLQRHLGLGKDFVCRIIADKSEAEEWARCES